MDEMDKGSRRLAFFENFHSGDLPQVGKQADVAGRVCGASKVKKEKQKD